MTINKTEHNTELILALAGRLDTTTFKELESIISISFTGKTNVVFDFRDLDYLSSAGLRVLLSAQKRMNKQGSLIIRNVNETIMEVFEVTGFADFLNIE